MRVFVLVNPRPFHCVIMCVCVCACVGLCELMCVIVCLYTCGAQCARVKSYSMIPECMIPSVRRIRTRPDALPCM